MESAPMVWPVNLGLDYMANFNDRRHFLFLAVHEHVLIEMFWQEGGGEPPKGRLGWAIDSHFGSYEALVQKMNTEGAALQGSGWVWLGLDKEFKKLVVETTANQTQAIYISILPCTHKPSGEDTILIDPLVTKGASLVPLLGIDVWEHAYYLQFKFTTNTKRFCAVVMQYKNVKLDYLKNIWKVANWKYANDVLEKESL
ncbi:hypothetical protein ACLOJK_012187 [Asimina triloba]